MRINSFKFKISVLYALILGTILILYSMFLYWGLSNTLYEELDKELKAKAKATISVLGLYAKAAGDSPRVLDYVFNRINSPEDVDARLEVLAKIDMYWARQFEKFNMQDDLMQMVTPLGELRGRSRKLSNDLHRIFNDELTHIDPSRESFVSDIHYKNKILRLVSFRCSLNNQPYVLQIATSQKPIIQLLKDRLAAIISSIPFIFMLMVILGIWLVNQLMRPVIKVTRLAENLSHKDLSARLEHPVGDHEMEELVGAFNDMIARLERSFKHIEEFSSQVAHELKTPLAIMRGESEVALRKERATEEYQRVLRVNLEEIERMLKTIDDLLLLTKLDYHQQIFKFAEMDFIDFYHEVFEQAKVLAQKKGLEFSCDLTGPVVVVNGDKHHLRRLFMNLIHNAVKFTPANGKISLRVNVQGSRLLAVVEDSGIGIAPEDLPHVFERFFHKDRTGVQEESGSGLGLSIALAIARVHGGDIKVESMPGQATVFTVSLPVAE